MPHSHHSHSGQFCKHATGTLEEVVLQAIASGFEMYGLTEHVPRYRELDFYPEERGLSVSTLQQQFWAFLEEAQRIKAVYSLRIDLLIGLETEYITELDLEELSLLLERYPLEIQYLVGSVHHVNGFPIDFDEPTYRKAVMSFAAERDTDDVRLEKFLSAYFDAQYTLLSRFKPEILGHIDLCRLYTPNLQLSGYPVVWAKVERNVEYAISYGALFEINAAAFRKNWSTAYPGRDIADLILRSGGRFALSDDSHGPHAVGLNFDRTRDYLLSINVSELWYLQSSGRSNAAGRKIEPKKLDRWFEHPFWHKNTDTATRTP